MEGYEYKLKMFAQIKEKILNVAKLLGANEHSSEYGYLDKVENYAKALFDRNPIKVGSRVRLIKQPDINEKDTPGWMHCRHYLVKGACGVVSNVDFGNKFEYYVVFDNESHIPSCGVDKGKEIPTPFANRGHFYFGEGWIELITDDVKEEIILKYEI